MVAGKASMQSLQQVVPSGVGLVAGWGRYPLVVAEALRAQGVPTYCLGVRNHADPALEELCTDLRWVGLAKIGAAIRYFRESGVERATMAGKIHKHLLFERWAWIKHLPDWRAAKLF